MLPGGTFNQQSANSLPPVAANSTRRQLIGQVKSAPVAGTRFQLTFKVPQGFKVVSGLYFNPEPTESCIMTLYSQNVNNNILNNVGTAIGTAMGFINPMHDNAVQDILTLDVLPIVVSGNMLVFTLQLDRE